MTTMASGRWSRVGISTCSTKARNTAVPVAAAMLMPATTPSSARAPSTVSRFQCPHGTLPTAPCPRHLAHGALTCSGTGVSPGHPGVDPALVKEDEALGVHLGQLGPPVVPRLGE